MSGSAKPREAVAWRPYEDGDAEGVSALFREELDVDLTPDVLRWKYARNPAGEPLLFELFEGERHIGQVGGIPQRMWVAGKEFTAVQSVDILLRSDARGGSTFLRSLKGYEKASAREGMAFMFGFPSGKFLTYLKKQKFQEVAAPVRMTLGLDGTLVLRKATRSGPLAAVLGPLLGLALRARARWAARPVPGVDVEPIQRFGPEFDPLWNGAKETFGVTSVRTAEYLNWRFAENPQYPYRCMAARSGGELQGYAVIRVGTEDGARIGMLVDLFARPGGRGTAALAAAAVRTILKEGADLVRGWAPRGSELQAALGDMGFVEREEGRTLVVKGFAEGLDERALADPGRWYFTFGDCDNY